MKCTFYLNFYIGNRRNKFANCQKTCYVHL